MLHRIRFSRVPSKKEWINRTVDNIRLPKYPSSMEELLAIDDPNKFSFALDSCYWRWSKDSQSIKKLIKESLLMLTVEHYMPLNLKV